jgi:hypothetical protein
MKFVADESCAGPVIRALREASHDVIAIAEGAKGATDDQVLARALDENGFSSLKITTLAIWYTRAAVRQQAFSWSGLTAAHAAPNRATVVEAAAKLGSRLQAAFAVVEPGRVRLSGWPPQP